MSVLREFKARVVEDFKDEWLRLAAIDERFSIEEATDAYGGASLNILSDRISGEVVLMTENTYPHGSNDFFDSIDNNFVIFPELFEEITEG